MKTLIKALTTMTMLAAVAIPAGAGDVAIKTNLLYDATATPSLGIELAVAPRWSIEVAGNFNNWTIGNDSDRRWKHWLVQPEVRYWFCEAFHGNFIGLQLHGGQYNMSKTPFLKNLNFLGNDFRGLKDTRYQGWYAGAGITYGHAWILGQHWNLEAEIGIGWAYTRYDRYPCAHCGRKIESNRVHNYVGPTEAAINLVYIF